MDKYTIEVIADNQTGWLLSTQPFMNGNVLYATGQLVFLTPADPRYRTGIDLCKAPNGAYARQPNLADNTSVDDYLAIGCISDIAKNLLQTARTNWGCLDIQGKKSWSQFIFRFQGFWQHLRISANESIGLFGQFIWALAIWLASKELIGNQDSWIQSRLMIATYDRRGYNHWLCEWAIKKWNAAQPEPTWQTMAKYINDDTHPLVIAWKNSF